MSQGKDSTQKKKGKKKEGFMEIPKYSCGRGCDSRADRFAPGPDPGRGQTGTLNGTYMFGLV